MLINERKLVGSVLVDITYHRFSQECSEVGGREVGVGVRRGTRSWWDVLDVTRGHTVFRNVDTASGRAQHCQSMTV